jgi:hypothetical protein
MSTERNYCHARRVCQHPDECKFPLCDCPLAVDVDRQELDKRAIHEELKRSRWRKTTRVKSKLP